MKASKLFCKAANGLCEGEEGSGTESGISRSEFDPLNEKEVRESKTKFAFFSFQPECRKKNDDNVCISLHFNTMLESL